MRSREYSGCFLLDQDDRCAIIEGMSKLSSNQRRTQIAAIRKAIIHAGGRSVLADRISKSINKSFSRKRIDDYISQGLPTWSAWEIYIAVGRKVPLHHLDPLNYARNKVTPNAVL